jgi:hypothetical protein
MVARTAVLVVILGMMPLLPLAQAANDTDAAEVTSQGEMATTADAPENSPAKEKGGTLLWIVLGLSFLLILGSALGLNSLGDKRPPPRRREDKGNAGD